MMRGMIRRRVLTALSLMLVAGPLSARAEEAPRKQVGQYVDLQPVGLPILVEGQLVNYVFVYVRLNLAPNADTSRWRAQEPFFRDALVRSGYASSFAVPGDTDKIDPAKLSAALMRSAQAITGPGVVRSVVVTNQVSRRRSSTAVSRSRGD
jgi:hypothetical protein